MRARSSRSSLWPDPPRRGARFWRGTFVKVQAERPGGRRRLLRTLRRWVDAKHMEQVGLLGVTLGIAIRLSTSGLHEVTEDRMQIRNRKFTRKPGAFRAAI
jgi:hypothetical protein